MIRVQLREMFRALPNGPGMPDPARRRVRRHGALPLPGAVGVLLPGSRPNRRCRTADVP